MPSPTSDTPTILTGPVRAPRQMLAEQSYAGHTSVHDAETAANLGLAGAPIEGPTHFSQFDPLLASLWGGRWFSHGCLSAHFQTMVVEGEEVQATVTSPGPGSTAVRIDAAKADGTPVLTGTASIDGDTTATELAPRLIRSQGSPPERLHVLDRISVGQRGPGDETITVAFGDDFGEMYPFSLADKLAAITEPLDWYRPGAETPWGGPVVPIEMLSVLTNAGSRHAGFVARQPSIGLFIDLEVRLLGSPVLVDHTYRIDREVVALGESRRTESYWTLTTMSDEATGGPTAQVLLHQGVFKDSYPDYPSPTS
ncbi:MAG: hypothetical protein QF796_05520 [Acidimicrobiales bacterium]|nr:hypothetical protein [Acidimicrobiales bacterium]